MSAKHQNRQGFARLDDWIRNLETFGDSIPEMTKSLVPVVESEAAEAVQGQRSMDGVGWAPTKSGKRALAGAMKAITVKAVGTVILITMRGHEVFHQFGFRGTPARPILPTAGMPKKLGNAIRTGIIDMGLEWMTRRGRHDRGSRGAGMVQAGCRTLVLRRSGHRVVDKAVTPGLAPGFLALAIPGIACLSALKGHPPYSCT